MNMTKADYSEKKILFLEGFNRSRRSKTLKLIDSFLKKVEIHLWIIPFIKKNSKNHELTVLTYDHEIANILKRVRNCKIEVLTHDYDKDEIKNLIVISHELFVKLQNYTYIKDKITFLDADLITIFEEEFTYLFFDRIKKINHVQKIIGYSYFTSIYVENADSLMGKIFRSVSNNKQIQFESIIPKLYGKLKNKVLKYLFYSRSHLPSISDNNLHLLSQNNVDGENGGYNIFAYVPYVNFLDAVFPSIKQLSKNKLCKKSYILGDKEKVLNYSNDFVNIPLVIEHLDVYEKTLKIKHIFGKLLKDDEFHTIFKYNGINWWKLIEDDIRYIVHKKFASIMLNLKECDVLLEMIRPDIVLVGDERTSYVRTCVLLAKNKKIPVIEIQHGIYTYTNPMIPPVSDKICVYGNYTKNVFIDAEGINNKLIVTGSSKYDSLILKRKSRIQPKDSDSCKYILFATEYGFEGQIRVAMKEVIRFLSLEKNVYLIIKPHPAEKSDAYHRYSKNCRRVIVKNSDANIDDLLLYADVLITISSTVGINAAILDVPIMLLNLSKIDSPYISISSEVQYLEEIIPKLKQLLYDNKLLQRLAEARKEFVFEHTYIQDGKASERIENVILDIIQESKR